LKEELDVRRIEAFNEAKKIDLQVHKIQVTKKMML